MHTGGDGGIRTLDRALQPYNGLANRRLQPLGHVSGCRRYARRCPAPQAPDLHYPACVTRNPSHLRSSWAKSRAIVAKSREQAPPLGCPCANRTKNGDVPKSYVRTMACRRFPCAFACSPVQHLSENAPRQATAAAKFRPSRCRASSDWRPPSNYSTAPRRRSASICRRMPPPKRAR